MTDSTRRWAVRLRQGVAAAAALGSLVSLSSCGGDVEAKVEQLEQERTAVRGWTTDLLTDLTEAKAGEVTWTGTEWPETDHETLREKATAHSYAVLVDLDVTSFDAVAAAWPDAVVDAPGQSLHVEEGRRRADFVLRDTKGRLTVTGRSVEIGVRDFAGSGLYDPDDDFPWPP